MYNCRKSKASTAGDSVDFEDLYVFDYISLLFHLLSVLSNTFLEFFINHFYLVNIVSGDSLRVLYIAAEAKISKKNMH